MRLPSLRTPFRAPMHCAGDGFRLALPYFLLLGGIAACSEPLSPGLNKKEGAIGVPAADRPSTSSPLAGPLSSAPTSALMSTSRPEAGSAFAVPALAAAARPYMRLFLQNTSTCDLSSWEMTG